MSVSLDALTAVQTPETKNVQLLVDATCRRVNLMLISAGTYHLAMERPPCMVLYSIQTLHAECQTKSVRTVELRVHQSSSTFADRSFGGLSDVLKKRLSVSLLGSLTTCTFRRLVHVSLNSPMQLVA